MTTRRRGWSMPSSPTLGGSTPAREAAAEGQSRANAGCLARGKDRQPSLCARWTAAPHRGNRGQERFDCRLVEEHRAEKKHSGLAANTARRIGSAPRCWWLISALTRTPSAAPIGWPHGQASAPQATSRRESANWPTRASNLYARRLLCEFARVASRTTAVHESSSRSLRIRRGHRCSIVVLIHELLRTSYSMFKRCEPCRVLAVDYEVSPVQRDAPRWMNALIAFGFTQTAASAQ